MPQAIKRVIEQYIAEIKKIYGTHLRKIILYGSYARGDFKAGLEEHFKKWIVNYPFYANINKEGVVLYGAA